MPAAVLTLAVLTLAVLALAVLTAVLTACAPGGNAGIPTFIPPTLAVDTAPPVARPAEVGERATSTVTRGTLTAVVEAPGRVEPLHGEELYFGTTGLVRTVHKEPGEPVVAGERIAELDAYTLERDLLQRASDLHIAQLNLSLVESRAAGQEIDPVSPLGVELAIARERVALAIALHDLAQAQLDQAVVIAPFSGTLTSFTRQRGSRINAYETVGVVADLTDVTILAWLPADALDGIEVGSPARVEFEQQPSAGYRAAVVEIAPYPTLREGSWAYELRLAWAPDEPAAGMPQSLPLDVTLQISGPTSREALLVATEAVTTFAGQAFVDILEPDGSLRNVPVETGIANATQTVILNGLEEGQIVLIP